MENSKKGFTIIELIVVIAIITVLAVIVLVSVTQYIQSSKDAAITAELKQFPVILTDYASNNDGSISNFCSSQNAENIGDKLSTVDSNYHNFWCMDPGGEYYVSNGGSGTSAPGGGDQTCIDNNTWIAFVYTSSDVVDLCIDSSGVVRSGEAFQTMWNHCACN